MLDKLLKMYQNNMYVVQQLKNSKIPEIELPGGGRINNLYELLRLNETKMYKKSSPQFKIPAPKYKFVINNASTISSNINGSSMLIPKSSMDEIENIINTVKTKVIDVDGKIKESELNNYILEMETELSRLKSELTSNFLTPIKEASDELKSNKSSGTMTEESIKEAEYKIDMLKYGQKKFEREQIMKATNILFLLKTIKEQETTGNKFFNELSQNYRKWFMDSQPIFGLYRSLQRAVFCPTSSMMDAMDNCSLKYNTT